MTYSTSPGASGLPQQQQDDQRRHQKVCSKNCGTYAPSNTTSPPATDGCCIPQWLGHPRRLKSYAVFEPFPEMEYRKVQKLASAIHGKVYLYEHIPTGKAVVVKKMPNVNVIQFDPRMLEDAMTEIGVSRYLATSTSGEFIARAFGIYQDEEFTYFMSEYSSGGELFDHVVNAKQFSEPVAKKYTWQVLRAVKSLHCNGIVHRDISLENTLLHDDGSVRVIDFGQAVLLNNPEGPTPNTPLLHSGRAGKAYYRAPEMYHGHYLGAPADLFAAGVMLFIMTVGTPPWNQASVADARFRYVAKFGVVKLLTSWQKAQLMSPELLDLLGGLMCVDPEKRMTVDEALDHPWFDDCDCEEQPLIVHSPRSLTPP
ncbi:calcium/calmodulin-dependent protein kinase 2, putative [Perkinsus marinus ATCC 50983]|uniref:Calcium/calmodulin-dependent protein kinase 2, putative n=1 Tax=Perkinsus marinus (strain ATCC 50983 / TXsc) TaxID=423536 RepID=C5KAP2_PERM5|nr:calcium/calmodulin-dependent protein kinase 2, putative [Perkinsus marinus ATCC 50983]EER18218.1 calcium/calmodulin-dependent protein kinase 2, putative [Perkinsus marinus ATCC 50983]|eukprot:XP_002786422.1 calcium/calmodulin-dependent protein kinase 2, putative [Perkinsus marinus ATCC 50983]